MTYLLHYIVSPYIGVLFLGLIPFVIVKKKRLMISTIIGLLHLAVALIMLTFSPSTEILIRLILVYGSFFLTIYILNKYNLPRSKFGMILGIVFILKLITRAVFY